MIIHIAGFLGLIRESIPTQASYLSRRSSWIWLHPDCLEQPIWKPKTQRRGLCLWNWKEKRAIIRRVQKPSLPK